MARDAGGGKVATRLAQTSKTLVELAADWLRESILSGELSAGERIRLDAIAQELGMSPIPVREALRSLATEGLVVPLAHRGYTVQPVTVGDLMDTYRLRLMLEPVAVQLAVPHLDEPTLDHLSEELDLLERAFRDSDWPSHRIHHRAFHFGMYDKCDSAWLLRFTDMLWVNSERYQRMTTRIKGELNERRKEHRRILAACREHDATQAAALMHDHLNSAAETIRAFLNQNQHMLENGGADGPIEIDEKAPNDTARSPAARRRRP